VSRFLWSGFHFSWSTDTSVSCFFSVCNHRKEGRECPRLEIIGFLMFTVYILARQRTTFSSSLPSGATYWRQGQWGTRYPTPGRFVISGFLFLFKSLIAGVGCNFLCFSLFSLFARAGTREREGNDRKERQRQRNPQPELWKENWWLRWFLTSRLSLPSLLLGRRERQETENCKLVNYLVTSASFLSLFFSSSPVKYLTQRRWRRGR
jgi:hypothetical protein